MKRELPCSNCRKMFNLSSCVKEEHPNEGWMWWTCPGCEFQHNSSLMPINVRYRQDIIARVEALETSGRHLATKLEELEKCMDKHLGAKNPHTPTLGAGESC